MNVKYGVICRYVPKSSRRRHQEDDSDWQFNNQASLSDTAEEAKNDAAALMEEEGDNWEFAVVKIEALFHVSEVVKTTATKPFEGF